MKKFFVLCPVLALIMLLTPIAAVGGNEKENTQAASPSPASQTDDTDGGEAVKVFRSASSSVETVSAFDYVCGVVAAEMPLSYHDEALMAQAVAAYTYAMRMKLNESRSPDSSLNGAYLSDESASHQSFINKSERKEKWGDSFDEKEARLETIVGSVMGNVVYYDGAPALTVYHSFCDGKTRSALDVWGSEIPYLVSVVSAGDRLSPDFDRVEEKGGHGVGMSQYGADYLARQGFSWSEILLHYYTGVEIEKEL